jgi:hypothetical protein
LLVSMFAMLSALNTPALKKKQHINMLVDSRL